MSYYKNFWRTLSNTGTSTPDFACSVGSIIDSSITPFLDSIRVTDNTILIDDANLLLSTNRQDPISINQTRVTPDNSPNAEVSKVEKGIMYLYGSFWGIPKGNETEVRQVRLGYAVGFPRSYMFSSVDQAGWTGQQGGGRRCPSHRPHDLAIPSAPSVNGEKHGRAHEI
ncbi:hypothetical protein BC829DRAFT_435796 [Chytridium lagenaria]|nr:hypothetical protein BC829DRAFT_435796 [Chytridium lagenaria]